MPWMLDAWLALKNDLVGKDPASAGAPSRLGSNDVTQYLEPDNVSARVGELTLMGKKLDKLILEASIAECLADEHRVQQAAGSVTWDEPGGGAARAR
jgi:hypothetical protein